MLIKSRSVLSAIANSASSSSQTSQFQIYISKLLTVPSTFPANFRFSTASSLFASDSIFLPQFQIRFWILGFLSPKMSSTDGAGAIAFKGLGMMLSASKQGMAALSGGLNKVRKQYATKHEADVLAELKKKGLRPIDILFQALQKLDYLSLAGYKHEVTLVSQQVAKRLLDAEKSTVPLEMVLVLGGSMSDEALRYGDFQKSSILQGLQEYINMSRMGKDHYDRDTMVHEFYYAILMCSEEMGGDWQQFEGVCKEAVRRVVTMGGAEDVHHDMQHKSAKALFTFASAVKIAAQQEEQRRNKSLRDAEALIQREQEKRAKMLGSQSSNSLHPASSLQPTSTI